jgi:uncharacterized protein YndB with AHSA1/START domain
MSIQIPIIMSTATSQSGKATTIKETFSRETTVSIDINADAAIVWTLLTNAADFARWNSTVTSLEGDIKLGGKLKLKSILDEKRTFKLKVKELEAEKKMVWGDGQGNRTYTLTPNGSGGIAFKMHEKIGGLMFPLYAKYIPAFDQSFEAFAADLKKEAEAISATN